MLKGIMSQLAEGMHPLYYAGCRVFSAQLSRSILVWLLYKKKKSSLDTGFSFVLKGSLQDNALSGLDASILKSQLLPCHALLEFTGFPLLLSTAYSRGQQSFVRSTSLVSADGGEYNARVFAPYAVH